MAQKSDGDWQKGQDVEIFDVSLQNWVFGKIYDIREVEDQKVFCVEYEEYSKEIKEKDVGSSMRTTRRSNEKSNERVEEEAFLNFSREIQSEIPLSHRVQHLSKMTRNGAFERMIYLYIERHREFTMYSSPNPFLTDTVIEPVSVRIL